MMRLAHAAAATLFSLATTVAYGQACTQTISPGANVTTTVEAAAPGARRARLDAAVGNHGHRTGLFT